MTGEERALLIRLTVAVVELLGNVFDDQEMAALRLEVGFWAWRIKESGAEIAE